ncbi:MAG: patatin-like phospholipase family protein [Candidatus Vecturithrix sp.]|jgi:NTE family protein|nr:patatin-like phospholipase family protein [Candidatus Vecturithrix sp.]
MAKILTIYSSEAKIGKTTLAVNLGVSLIHETQKTVILVDLSSADDGGPAWSMLKFPGAKLFQGREILGEGFSDYIQYHSSQLAVLTIDSEIIHKETSSKAFVIALFDQLRRHFDYILVDISTHLNRMAYEVIDESDVFIMVVSSPDYEQPIGIIGHHNTRIVINMPDESKTGRLTGHQPGLYVVPCDTGTVENFRRSGIPFVIQAPYRPLSQVIGRLARDIGEKRFGIALTGGVALGLSQLGILEVLEQNRIAIDMLTGVSFGALLGAAYATGLELRQIKQRVIDWAQSCRHLPTFGLRRLFQQAFYKETKLQQLCDLLLKDVYFEELLIPVNVVAIDIRTGEHVVFREGKVLDAIESSMRIPRLFAPFKQTERHLIDSSVIYPTPVYPLNNMGANVTVAVVVTPSPAESQRYVLQQSVEQGDAAQQATKENYALVAATFDSLMERLTDTPDSPDNLKRVTPDIFIRPQIRGISWRDFHKVHELIDCGIAATEAVIPELEKLKWG